MVVAADGLDVGLVHRDPVLHPVAEAPEAHVCVRGEIIAATARTAVRGGSIHAMAICTCMCVYTTLHT